MKTVKKKSTGRAGKQVLSTSEARANFAEALATARVGGAVIGFDRYGKTVAALVPVEAVYMLAGMGDALSPAVRTAIKRQAVSFVEVAPSENLGAQPARASRAKKAVKKKPVTKSSRRRASRG